MSKQVDERVVSMQFDNAQFERNVSTTMSTLDKLKQKLHLDGAVKGLENVGAATKNINMNGLGNAVEQVSMKFSAMQVMGVTALTNITNQAVNAGKRMVSALTIDPVKTGFSEYETKINSIQTILANTQSKGTTMEDVTRIIDELNTYADKTIYNFQEMTRNIGTFTAAGVGLEESATAIKGIANLAAVSGSNSQQASTAMYQLSQALASGTVKLMDWNSVVNAGMGGQVFQDALKNTARVHGVAIDQMIENEGSFRETLKSGWLTSEILTETLENFTLSAEEGTEQWEKYKKSLMDKGYTEEQAISILKMGNTATDAATKVKTFTQLWDTLKESAQSGWGKTWELIVGDFEDAKETLSKLSDILGGFINRMSDFRNFIVEGVMDFATPWAKITEKLDNAGLGGITKIAEKVGDAADKLEYFQDIVNKVWRGDYDVAPNRYQLLEEAGYDHRVVQDLVNKGYQYKITVEDIEASHKKFGLTMETTTESTEKATSSFQSLTDEQLRNAKLTDDEIKLYRDLEKEADRLGISVDDLIKRMSEKDGRTLLIESLSNAGNGLIGVFTALKDAWFEIFPAPSIARIYSALDAINKFSSRLKLLNVNKETGEYEGLNETGKKLIRTFKGVFAILDVVATLAGSGLKIAFNILTAILEYFDMDILDFTANIGDMLVKFRDWVDSVLNVKLVISLLLDILTEGIKRAKEWYASFKETDTYKKIASALSTFVESVKGCIAAFDAGKAIEYLTRAMSGGVEVVKGWYSAFKDTKVFGILSSAVTKVKDAFSGWFKGLKETDNVPKYIIQGLVNGIKEGVPLVVGALFDLAASIVTAICDVLGIHSPSVVFFAIGGFLIAGLVRGIITGEHTLWNAIVSIAKSCITWIKDMLTGVSTELQNGEVSIFDMVKSATSKIVEFLKGIDWGALFAAGTIIGFLAIGSRIVEILDSLTSPLEGFNDVLQSTSKVMNAFALKLKADALMSISIAIAILAASLVVLSFVDPLKLGMAVLAVGVLVTGLVAVIKSISKLDERAAKDVIKFAGAILVISGALLLVVLAMKLVADISDEGMARIAEVMVGIAVIVGALMFISGKLGNTGNLDMMGNALLKIAATMLIFCLSIKMLAGMSKDDLNNGALVIAEFAGIIIALVLAMKLISLIPAKSGLDDVGKTIIEVAGAILIMVLITKIISGMDEDSLNKGIITILKFSGIIAGLMLAVKLFGGNNANKLGSTLMGIAGAMAIMAVVVRLIGSIDEDVLRQGIGAIGAFAVIIAALVWTTRLAGGNDLTKVGTTLFMMAISIGVLAAVAALMSLIKIENLAKGIVAVGLLTTFVALLVHSLKDAQQCVGTIVALTVMIGVLVAAVTLLTFLDPVKLAVSTLALSMLMGMMSLLIATTSKLQKAKGTIVTLLALTGVVVVLAGVVALLSFFDATNAIPNTIALSILIMTLSGVLVILDAIKVNIKDIASGLLGLLGLTAILYALTGALAIMSNIDKAASNALILSGFVTALTLLLYPLALVGVIIGATGGVAALGLAALLGMAVILYALTGALAIMSCIKDAETNTMLLVKLMTAMTIMLVAISLVAPLAVIAVAAIAALTLLMVGIGTLAVAIGALMQQFPQLESFLDTGIPIMEKLAYGIGSMVGNLIAGFSTAVTTALPEIATSLSWFMTALQPFIAGVKMVDERVAVGVGILTAAILALTAASFLNGLVSFMSCGMASLPALGTSLSMFLMNATPFILGASMIDEKMMAGVKSLAETILILTAADILNGLTAWFTGGTSLETFGTQIGNLGAGLKSFSEQLGEFTEDQLATVTCAAQAIKTLAEASKTIPNVGGLLADIVGDNDLGTFASYFPVLGSGLRNFLTNVGTFSDAEVATVNCAAEAVKTLAAASKEIPNTGGLLADIVGDNGLDTFASAFPTLGTSLSGFLTNVGTFSEDEVNTVTAASEAVKVLASASKEIPNTGGWLAEIVGDNSLQTFASSFPTLGTGLRGFLDNVKTFTDVEVTTVTCASNAVKSLAEVSQSIPNMGGWLAKIVGDNGLGTFGTELPKLGEGLAGFVEKVGTFSDDQVSTVESAINATKTFTTLANANLKNFNSNISTFGAKLVEFGTKIKDFLAVTAHIDSRDIAKASGNVSDIRKVIDKLAGIDAKAAENFKNAINELGKSGVKKFVEAFTCSDSVKSVKNAGKDMVDDLIDGIEDKEKDVKTACGDLVKEAAAKLKSKDAKEKFYNAGSYLVDGFVSGIDDNDYKAAAQARAMAKDAAKAAEKELQINSPSKVFKKIGKSVPEGFALGIEALGDTVAMSTGNMGDTAIDSLRNTIRNIAAAIDSDMDVQPTIRPLLDLSDVESGASSINGMFDFTPTTRFMANVGAINASMSQRQNGVNSGRIGNSTNIYNTYQVDGVTYDDGSNIADAVRTIVRAARIERRV